MADRKYIQSLLDRCDSLMSEAGQRIVAVFSELSTLQRVTWEISRIITKGAVFQTVAASINNEQQYILTIHVTSSVSSDELRNCIFYMDNLRVRNITKEYAILR